MPCEKKTLEKNSSDVQKVTHTTKKRCHRKIYQYKTKRIYEFYVICESCN